MTRPRMPEKKRRQTRARAEGKARQDKGKEKGKDKDKGKGKGKLCSDFNDKGCKYGSNCKMLHEAPAMAPRDDQMRSNPAPKAKAAADSKAAAATIPAKP